MSSEYYPKAPLPLLIFIPFVFILLRASFKCTRSVSPALLFIMDRFVAKKNGSTVFEIAFDELVFFLHNWLQIDQILATYGSFGLPFFLNQFTVVRITVISCSYGLVFFSLFSHPPLAWFSLQPLSLFFQSPLFSFYHTLFSFYHILMHIF